MPALQGSSADRSQWREPPRTSEGLCSLYEAALCLFEEVRIRLVTDLRSVFFLNGLMFEVRAGPKNQNPPPADLQARSCSTFLPDFSLSFQCFADIKSGYKSGSAFCSRDPFTPSSAVSGLQDGIRLLSNLR